MIVARALFLQPGSRLITGARGYQNRSGANHAGNLENEHLTRGCAMNKLLANYDDFLSFFPDKPRVRAGNGWLVLCPAHNDHSPSLWIKPSDNLDFIATWDCEAGCRREDVLKAIGLTWNDVRNNGATHSRVSNNGSGCQPVNGSPKQLQNRVDTPN